MISIEKAFDIAKQFGETNGHIIRSQYCLDDLSYFGIIPKEYEKKETIPLIEIAYVVNMTTGDIIKWPMFQMIEVSL